MKNRIIKRILCALLSCMLVITCTPIKIADYAYASTNLALHGDKMIYTYESSYSNLQFKIGDQITPVGLATGDDVYVYLKSQYAYGTKTRYLLYIYPKYGSLTNTSVLFAYDPDSNSNVDTLFITQGLDTDEVKTCKSKEINFTFKVFSSDYNANGIIKSLNWGYQGNAPSGNLTYSLVGEPEQTGDSTGVFTYTYSASFTVYNEGDFNVMFFTSDNNYLVKKMHLTVSESHQYDDGVVTQEATETHTGILTKTCSICGDQITETIPRIVVTDKYSETFDLYTGGERVRYFTYPSPNVVFTYETGDENIKAKILRKQQSGDYYIYTVGFLVQKSGTTEIMKALDTDAAAYLDTFTFNVNPYYGSFNTCVGYNWHKNGFSASVPSLPRVEVSGPSTDYNVTVGNQASYDPFKNYGYNSEYLSYVKWLNGTFNEKGTYIIRVYDSEHNVLDHEITVNVGDHQYSAEVTTEPTHTNTGVLTKKCSVCGDSFTETLDKIPYDLQFDMGNYQTVDIHCDGMKTASDLIITSSDESVAGASARVTNSSEDGTDLALTVFGNKPGMSTVTISDANDGTVYGTAHINVNKVREETSRICKDKEVTFDVHYISNDKNDDPSITFSKELDFDLIDSIETAEVISYDNGLSVGNVVPHSKQLTMSFKQDGATDMSLYNSDGELISVYHLTVGGHNYTLTNKTEATCITRSEEIYECDYCGDSYTKEVGDFADHNWSDNYTIDKKPTCIEEGLESIHCTVCNQINEGTQRYVAKIDHEYSDWVVTKPATCTEDGIREQVCSGCGDKITEAIEAKGHIWRAGFIVDKEATCEESGIKSIHCAACDIVKEGSEKEIPATGHQWEEEYTVDKTSSCTEEGSESIHCAVCEAIKEDSARAIAKVPHPYGEWSTAKEPTCSAVGIKERICMVCGDKETEEIPIDPDSHKYGDWFVSKEASCTESGVETRVCSYDAMHIEEREIASLGHNYINGVCSRCGEKKVIESGYCGPDLKYVLYGDGELRISGNGIMDANPFYTFKDKITEVVIENGASSIGNGAFDNCVNLRKIAIPESVTSLGYNPFNGCNNLDGVYITDLASWCGIDFQYDYGSTNNPLIYAKNLYLNDIKITDLVIPDSVNTISKGAFSGCNCSSVTIPSSVTEIGAGAFSYCQNISTVEVPETVNRIGADVFAGCSNLVSAFFPASFTLNFADHTTGYLTRDCYNLRVLRVPYDILVGAGNVSVSPLDELIVTCEPGSEFQSNDILKDAQNLKKITVEGDNISIGNSAFYGNNRLKEVILSEGVISIGSDAFAECTELESIALPESLNIIGGYAFYNCTNIKDLKMPENLKEIHDGAFASCISIKTIEIPEGITEIKANTFDGCTNLKSIELPDSIKFIGMSAFRNCNSMSSIELPLYLEEIQHYAFFGCTGLEGTLNIPFPVKTIGFQAFYGCKGIKNISINGDCNIRGNRTFEECNIDKVILLEGSKTTEACSGIGGVSEVIIPEGVETIAGHSFSGEENIEYIKLPNSLITIEEHAFYNCTNLANVIIPDNVRTIGEMAFYRCSSLNTILIPGGVTSIGKSMLGECNDISSIYLLKNTYAETWCNQNGFNDKIKYVYKSGEHYYNEVITKQPSYNEPGVKTITCVICGETITKEIPKNSMTRVFGSSRYDTSIKSADTLKEQLGLDKFDNVIIACGTNYADALAGSYLSCVKKAPILLVRNRQAEIDLIQDYIKANLNQGGTIYLLGGSAVVPDAATAGLSGYNVKRLWGADRYATNVAILEEAGVSGDEIIVASGTGFADSLSASATGKPILLVKNVIQPSQKAYVESLAGKKFYLIGGTGAVNADIERYFRTLGSVTRLGGATRFDTSVKVAETFFKNPNGAVLAYGQDFPDGLCGGSVANAMGGPLLLATSGKSSQAAAYAKANGIKYGAVLGGPTLINDAAVRTIFQMGANNKILVK